MASISKQKNGRRMIQFVGPDNKRQTIRLGKMPQRQADALKIKVEQLVAARISGYAANDETQLWLTRLDSAMLNKLAKVGLIPQHNQGQQATLQEFIDSYIAKRTDVKGATATVYGHTRRNLIEFFGVDMPLRDISPGDADEWRLYLIEQGLAEDTTVRRRCGIANQYFTAAARKKLIPDNPFSDLKSVVQANESRSYSVTQDETEKVLDACPDAQWRLIFALCRYGGLRCRNLRTRLLVGDVVEAVLLSPVRHHVYHVVTAITRHRLYADAAYGLLSRDVESAAAVVENQVECIRRRFEITIHERLVHSETLR